MSFTAEVSKADVEGLNRSIKRIVQKTGRKQHNLGKQLLIFALQSAAKATAPIVRGAFPKKYVLRPIEQMVNTGFFWYKWVTGSGNSGFFKSERLIKNRKDGSLKRITRGIKYWNRRKQGWDYMPSEAKGKFDPSNPRSWIPNAGLAKAGWLLSLSKLGRPVKMPGKRPGFDVSDLKSRKTATEIYFEAANNVEYVSKTSPQSAAIGLRKAKNKLDNYYLKKFGIEIEQEGI